MKKEFKLKFPSPYGVSFILIKTVANADIIVIYTTGFRLLTEYHSFL